MFERMDKLSYASEVVFPWAISLVKCSVLAFYWRLFHVGSIRKPILVVAAAIVAWAMASASLFSSMPTGIEG